MLASVVMWSVTLGAQPKTDVVTLSNGDRITGEIVTLNRGRLEFKTDDAGTLSIEWDKITKIEATRQFEVETSDGRRVLGSLESDADRSVRVVTIDGAVTYTTAEVTRVTPIGTSFWKRIEGSIALGFNYTRSSGIATTTVNADAVYRRPDFQFRLTTSATVTEQSDADEPDDRALMRFMYIRYEGRRWFYSGGASVETNESLGLELRTQVAGVVGLRPVNTNRAYFEFGGGAVVNEEQGIDTPPTENIEGLGEMRAAFFTYDGHKTQLFANLQYYPSLSQWGRQRLQVDASFKRELWKDFSVDVHVFDTFDSEPPNPDAARNDVGVVLSVGWSF